VITAAIARELSGFVLGDRQTDESPFLDFPRHVADRLDQLFLTQKEIVTDLRREPELHAASISRLRAAKASLFDGWLEPWAASSRAKSLICRRLVRAQPESFTLL
jgi:hypothetical protein